MNTVKLTVTIPGEDFKRIELEKKKQGLTRSALFQKMVVFFFEKQSEKQKISDYIAGYKKKPEKLAEAAARTKAQIQSLGEF